MYYYQKRNKQYNNLGGEQMKFKKITALVYLQFNDRLVTGCSSTDAQYFK